MDADFAIVGGGLVGLAVAWGLQSKGQRVVVLDGTDDALRASRGNFGLVWVQGKGLKEPRYAKWSQRSAALWGDFAEELEDGSGVDVALEQEGGLDLHFDDRALEQVVVQYERLKDALDGDYPFEVLDAKALQRAEPGIGGAVAGGVLHHQDGHADPLALLRALSRDVQLRGGQVVSGAVVSDVQDRDGTYELICENGQRFQADKVVLAAGLGAAELGPKLGFQAPVTPERGQILITERLPPMIRRPSLIARQVQAGAVQIGATNELVGMDDRASRKGIAQLAAEAVAAYPALANAQLVRSWGALRVMSPDGLPIYQESEQWPGVFLVTCHSGVTLAAAHARVLPDWLMGVENAPVLEVFGEARFSFQ